MAYIYDLADTWNASGTTFTAIKMNVTDSASAAASLLMDLQVGGVSRVSVSKGGTIFSSLNNTSVPALSISAASDRGFGFYGNRPSMLYGGTVSLSMPNALTIALNSTTTIGWGSGNPIDTTIDTIVLRDAANTLGQRNGVNAQAKNIYNTYTDASNYERGYKRWTSNVLEIGTEALGTGSVRSIRFNPSAKLLMPIGSVTTASDLKMVFNGFETTGFGANSENLAAWLNGNLELNLSLNSFRVRRDAQFGFASSGNNNTAADAGIARNAAGVVRITNGSTGTGQLIFIVPTTNPGITGALWNNAGTLSIS